jgi:hypothetical protein
LRRATEDQPRRLPWGTGGGGGDAGGANEAAALAGTSSAMIWHKADEVCRAFPSWKRSILAEIYLCHACSCHEILRMATPGQVFRTPRAVMCFRLGRPALKASVEACVW